MGRFSQLRSSEEVGSFDGPFSPSELRRDLGVCVDSAVGLDGVPYSLFKVPFPWWQCALLNFFNLVLSWGVVPTLVTLNLKFELVHRSPLHGKIVGLLKGESSPLCSSICSSTPWLLTSGSWHPASASCPIIASLPSSLLMTSWWCRIVSMICRCPGRCSSVGQEVALQLWRGRNQICRARQTCPHLFSHFGRGSSPAGF